MPVLTEAELHVQRQQVRPYTAQDLRRNEVMGGSKDM